MPRLTYAIAINLFSTEDVCGMRKEWIYQFG